MYIYLLATSLLHMHEVFLLCLLQNLVYACDRSFAYVPADDRIMSKGIVCM
jgi:hypothetical protein